VGAFGESDNPHANRILAEDGGEGYPGVVSPDHVVLVDNYDAAQYTHGQVRDDCLGCGVFARVGFNCRIPPLGDGMYPDPQFVNFDADGLPLAGDDALFGTEDDPPPDSPTLRVTQGYILFHLLQGNSNNGPGGKNFGDRDANGPDLVILELWKVEDIACPPQGDTRITDLTVDPAGGPPGTFTATATAEDTSGDPILYTFVAENRDNPPETITVGPRLANTAELNLATVGTWTITATVDDDPACPDQDPDATRSVDVEVSAVTASWKPCDSDGNGSLELTDVILFLNYSFVGNVTPDCLGGLDCDGNKALELTDAIVSLNFQFVTGVAPGGFPFECKEFTQAADGTGDPCPVSQSCTP